ncbi:MAG: enoyl-CoA hydratase/isomerase family protein [Polyangiales bacterium]
MTSATQEAVRDFETIRYEQNGAVGVITLDRPKCLNAINFAMRDELTACLRACASDSDTRVILLTGAGRAFSAGLDLKEPAIAGDGPMTPKRAYEAQRTYSQMILDLRRVPQPIVAAIHGPAIGAGFSIAMACDIRLASPTATFQAAYINLNLGGADMGSSWLLPRAVGSANAARYLLSGDVLPADEALRIGFVQSVVDQESLIEEAGVLAKKLASKSPLGLRLTKEALDAAVGGLSLEQTIRIEDRNQAMCISQLMGGR